MASFKKVKPESERKRRCGREPVSDEVRARIVEMYNRDFSFREIADECHVSIAFISLFVRKLREEQEDGVV